MSSDKSALGDRMKTYEAAARYVLPRRTYSILRLDGKSFHSYLRGAGKPFDAQFMEDMDDVTAVLCRAVTGTVFAYTQSDEISLLLTDFGSVHAEAWFGGNVQKIVSVSAAAATSALGALRPGFPLFDSRVFTIADPVEVANYFVWRQRDCVRNSVSMAAQAQFSHRRLHGLNGSQMQELLWQEKGINWNDYPAGARRGRVCQRVTGPEEVRYTDKRTQEEHVTDAIRSRWVSSAAPRFKAEDGSFLADVIPVLPALRGVPQDTDSPDDQPDAPGAAEAIAELVRLGEDPAEASNAVTFAMQDGQWPCRDHYVAYAGGEFTTGPITVVTPGRNRDSL